MTTVRWDGGTWSGPKSPKNHYRAATSNTGREPAGRRWKTELTKEHEGQPENHRTELRAHAESEPLTEKR